jgi:glycosyltransferase involved in cell wall biosynthesis
MAMSGGTSIGATPSESALPFVSVIVPVFNGADNIGTLLQALRAQSYPADRREFIIVDDCSTDTTVGAIEACGAEFRVVRCERNGGSYTARNHGLRAAVGSVIAFTDADCRPDLQWLAEGVQALTRQGGGLVAGAVSITPTDASSAIQRYDATFGIQQAFFAKKLQFGATANLLVERRVVTRVGGFDASLRSGGDRKFCRAAVALGETFGYCPLGVVRHLPRTSYSELAIKQIRISTGQVHIFPRWTRLYMFPLGARDPDSFDRSAFESCGAFFKARFRAVYYSLEFLHVLVYGWGCLGRREKNQ